MPDGRDAHDEQPKHMVLFFDYEVYEWEDKDRSHTVVVIGNQERRFEVHLPTDKFGTWNVMRMHNVKIGNEEWSVCECTCNKPKLIPLLSSHVMVACRELEMGSISFIYPYYLKEFVLSTWIAEMLGSLQHNMHVETLNLKAKDVIFHL
jgi:hypothetical protein